MQRKSPEAGAGVAGLEASVAGAERVQGRETGDKGRETVGSRASKASKALAVTLAFA